MLLLKVPVEYPGKHDSYIGQQLKMIKDKRHASRVSATRPPGNFILKLLWSN